MRTAPPEGTELGSEFLCQVAVVVHAPVEYVHGDGWWHHHQLWHDSSGRVATFKVVKRAALHVLPLRHSHRFELDDCL